jgi:hypothetical protein
MSHINKELKEVTVRAMVALCKNIDPNDELAIRRRLRLAGFVREAANQCLPEVLRQLRGK